jgi:hypothetical protein
MKSYIKLYGPSIDRAFDALDEKFKELNKHYPFGEIILHAISHVDPSIDMVTGSLVQRGREELGDYDYVVEWNEEPKMEQVRGLIRQVDEALLYTGCRYTITTK